MIVIGNLKHCRAEFHVIFLKLIASMDLVNKIHMPEHCLERLAPFVSHEVHKIVNVKGKGEMRTVFVTLDPYHARVRQ